MTRYRVIPYKQGSKSAKRLAEALGGRVLRLSGSTFAPAIADVVINWGYAGTAPHFTTHFWGGTKNNGSLINRASNKLKFFRCMRDAGQTDIIPRFWENINDIPDDAFPVVCRTVLAGHSGDGIVIADTRDDLVPAQLYVQYVKKKDEYRIHVGLKKEWDEFEPVPDEYEYVPAIISIQRKARRHDTPDEQVNWQVRNHSNGFVFVRQNVNPPASVLDVAKATLLAIGLDFGAVDVIWNEKEQKAYVLEINTAPGLEGQTVTDYANFFMGN